MDHLSSEARSALMSRVRGRHTRPELAVRRAAHALGYRFRLHRRDLPGTPDLVFPGRRVAMFVHGCFWHAHDCSKSKAVKTNSDYWAAKLRRNAERDARTEQTLIDLGWRVVTIWECETKKGDILLARLRSALNGETETSGR